MYKITLAVPCFGRPERTVRALDCVMNQDMDGWEAYFVGDKCPNLQEFIDNGKAAQYIERAKEKGNKLAIFNLPYHYGGWGYQARNTVIKLAHSEYFMFMDNDDVIKKHHFSHYYEQIKKTEYDFMYFNTWIDPIENASGIRGRLRDAKLEHGLVGHQELIIKTDFLKKMPPQKKSYQQDWDMIDDMVKAGAKYSKGTGEPTHIIMGVGELRETEID